MLATTEEMMKILILLFFGILMTTSVALSLVRVREAPHRQNSIKIEGKYSERNTYNLKKGRLHRERRGRGGSATIPLKFSLLF